MSVLVSGDTELAVLNWTKAQAAVSTLVGGQIGFSIPNKTPPLPFLELFLVSETHQVGDPLIVDSRMQFSCWGKVNDKATTAAIARAVATAAHNMLPFTTVTPQGSTKLHGAVVDTVLWIPEPQSNFARHTVDVIFTATTF